MRENIGKRNFLFLQGPISPFFNKLARELEDGRYSICKIQLCYSDRLWWNFDLIPYENSLSSFGSFIEDIILVKEITDIVLLGENRPYHEIAIDKAKFINCDVWIFEEGYVRPYTVTLEYNSGVNNNSEIPRYSGFYENYIQKGEDSILMKFSSPLRVRLFWDLKYHMLNFLQRKKFPEYKHHRQASTFQEYLGWLRRFSKKFVTDKFVLPKKIRSIKNKPFFLVPLQLSHDYQITLHSDYNDITEMITEVLESFDRFANEEDVLIFKIHPIDTFLINPVAYIDKALNRKPHLKHRIIVLDGGDLESLIKNSKGVVVINSTAGLKSLLLGKPTKALGKAIYNFSSLADQQKLDSFWRKPQKPDMDLIKKFYSYLLDHCLVNGSFYSERGIDIAASIAANRIRKDYEGF